MSLESSNHDYGALCPWFDMCNHSERNDNVRYDYSNEKGMELRCTVDIPEGNEILISYSSRPDDDLVLDYGQVHNRI